MKYRLTATAVQSEKPRDVPYKLADGCGLYLLVKPSGTKLWRYKFRLEGKELTYSIGGYPAISLAQARAAHGEARQLVAKGVSPVLARKAKKQEQIAAAVNSFESIARQWIAENEPQWKPSYCKQVRKTLERDVYPGIGKLKIKEVTASDVRAVIKAVANRTKPTDNKRDRGRGAASVAKLIHQWCGGVFRYAIIHGLADTDPTYALRGLITRPKVQHHRHLVADELPDFMEKLKCFTGTPQVKVAIELLLLTFVRTGELRNAEWHEIDLGNALWRIPAHKMKMGRDHLVPLSSRALELLASLRESTGTTPFLFPNQRSPKTVMSVTTVNRALERMGYGGRVSGHGFRGTASTYLHEKNYPAQYIEIQLAHDKKNTVAASYNHATHLPERVKMMEDWSNFLAFEKTNIFPLKKTA